MSGLVLQISTQKLKFIIQGSASSLPHTFHGEPRNGDDAATSQSIVVILYLTFQFILARLSDSEYLLSI